MLRDANLASLMCSDMESIRPDRAVCKWGIASCAHARSFMIASSINWRTTALRPIDDPALPALIRDPGFMIERKAAGQDRARLRRSDVQEARWRSKLSIGLKVKPATDPVATSGLLLSCSEKALTLKEKVDTVDRSDGTLKTVKSVLVMPKWVAKLPTSLDGVGSSVTAMPPNMHSRRPTSWPR